MAFMRSLEVTTHTHTEGRGSEIWAIGAENEMRIKDSNNEYAIHQSEAPKKSIVSSR